MHKRCNGMFIVKIKGIDQMGIMLIALIVVIVIGFVFYFESKRKPKFKLFVRETGKWVEVTDTQNVASHVTEMRQIDLASVIKNSKSLTQSVKSVIAKADRMLICNCKYYLIETKGIIHHPANETTLTGAMYIPFDLAYYLVDKAYKGRLRFLTKDDKTRFYTTIKDIAVYKALKGDEKFHKLRDLKQVKIGLHVDKLPVSIFNVK